MTLCVALYVRFGKVVVVVCKLWEGKAILEGVVGYCWVYRCLGDCFEVFRSAHDWKGVILRVSTVHLGLLFRSLLVGDQTVLFFVMGQNV